MGAQRDDPTQLYYCDVNVDVISLHSNRIRACDGSIKMTNDHGCLFPM
jgi:hypothetical protein